MSYHEREKYEDERSFLDCGFSYIEDIACEGDLVISEKGFTNIIWTPINDVPLSGIGWTTFAYDINRWKIARMVYEEDVFLVMGPFEYESYSMAFDQRLSRKMLMVIYDDEGECRTGFIMGYRWNIVAKGKSP